jgi:cytochrome P450
VPSPQPRPLPPFRLLKAVRSNALECWTEAHFKEPLVFGGFPFARVAVVSDPTAIRRILVEDHSAYRKSTLERRVLSARLADGLIAVDGEQWQRQRRMFAPMFTRKMVMGFAQPMAAAVADVVRRWERGGDGSIVDVKSGMGRLAMDGLLRCIFSDGIGDRETICAETVRYFAVGGSIDPFDIIGLPDFVPRLTRLGSRTMLRNFDQAFRAAVDERRRSLAKQPDAPRDMLGAMLLAKDAETGQALSAEEVKGNVLTFIFAGQESTSTALTWTIYLLSQSPEWRDRIVEEVQALSQPDAGELAADRLVNTRAVVQEALRLYPPIMGITRTATRDTELAGRPIRRGTMLIISPYVLHRHRLLWQDPDVFDPARFLDPAVGQIEKYAYLPFGVGPRMCVGAAFALQEAALAVATLLKHFQLELAPGQIVWPVQRFTITPRDGLRMVVRRRRTPSLANVAA